MAQSATDITEMLSAWSRGGDEVLPDLMAAVYEELRRMAHRHLGREQDGHTLQTTALVHEAYLRLVNQKRATPESRGKFYAIASQHMRRILVDHYRSRRSAKRGGGATRVVVDDSWIAAPEKDQQIIALDDALNELASFDARKARVVELKFFAGLSVDEAALALHVSPGTVMRDWTIARAWLHDRMTKRGEHGS